MTAGARFAIKGEVRPDTLLRTLNLFAQLGLTPVTVKSCRKGDHVAIHIVQNDLAPDRAAVIAEKMRALVTVSAVHVTFLPAGTNGG